MLRKIGLQNFKCWQALDIDLAPITLFFGSNSSGKTAILQSLLLLKQTARGFDPDQHINFGGENDFVKFGSYQDLVFGHDIGKNAGISLKWNTCKDIFFSTTGRKVNKRRLKSINYEVVWGIDKRLTIHKLAYEAAMVEAPTEYAKLWQDDESNYRMSASYSENDKDNEIVDSPKSCYILPWTRDNGAQAREHISIHNLNGEFERNMQHINYLGPLRSPLNRLDMWSGGRPAIIDSSGANTIQSLIASHRDDRKLISNVARWLASMRLVENFQINAIDDNEKWYEAKATIGGVESSLVDVGFGVSQVLPVITMLLSAPEGSIILLEQPELHLHPNAQSALADLLLYVAEQRKLQLIVESHSEHLLRRLQRRIAEAQPDFATPANIKMYFCQAGEAGAAICEVGIDRFGQISNWPENFLGDISGDLHKMLKAALERRGQELERVGHRG